MTKRILADYVFVFIWSYCISIGFFSFFNLPKIYFLIFLLGIISIITTYILFRDVRDNKKISFLLIIATVFLGICLANIRYQNGFSSAERYLKETDNADVIFGKVLSSPIQKEGTYLLKTDSGHKIFIESPFKELTGGTVVGLENTIGSLPSDYFYSSSLYSEKVFLYLKNPKVTIVENTPDLTRLETIKNSLDQSIERAVPYPESRVLSAMILGFSDIPKELTEALARAGIIHIVSISGMHVAIIAASLFYLFSKFSTYTPQTAILSVITLVFLYILFIGAPASAVRSGLMIGFYFLARSTGRKSKIGRATIVALFFMLIYNPYLLIHDIGFQLSFLAILGIVYFSPWLKEKISKKTDTKSTTIIKEIVTVSLGAQIATTPIILYHFGSIALLSPFYNLLIVPTLPFILGIGVLGMILGLISHTLSYIIQFPVYVILKITDTASEFALAWNFLNYKTPLFATFTLLLQTAIFILLLTQTTILQKSFWQTKIKDIVL